MDNFFVSSLTPPNFLFDILFLFLAGFLSFGLSANGAPKNMSVLLNINADRNIRTNLQSWPNFGAPTIFESEAELSK